MALTAACVPFASRPYSFTATMAHNYYIPLNKPTLLFFPHTNDHEAYKSAASDSDGHVIMVTVKGAP